MEYPQHGTSFDDALSQVGVGKFQWLMLGICGLANAADATEILSIGLVATGAERALNLTPQRQGALNACLFVGMFLGGVSWGLLGDKIGRKRALLIALFINALFGLISAASQNLGQLIFLRLLAGLGVGGSMPVVFAQLSELCPASARGKFLALLASFWMVGSLYSSTFGWIIIPTYGWRLFVAVASLPAWTCCACIWLFMPESPRYLMVMGNYKDATEILQRAAKMNGRTLSDELRLTPVDQAEQVLLDGAHHHAIISASSQGVKGFVHTTWDHTWNATQRTGAVMKTLFTPPLRRHTLPLALGWIGLCGGWYCTVLWVPRYFEERGAQGSSIYAQTFAVSLANLPGNLASIYLVDALGRRWTSCVCMAGACLCALAFAMAPAHGVWPTVAACVFNAVSVGGWNSLDMISSELYPTTVRASGFGVLNAIGRVSSFLTTYAAGALLEVKLWAPLVVAAGLLAIGSIAMLMLPEPAGKPLEDTVQECAAHAPRFHLSGGGGGEADDLPSGLAATERWNVRKSVEESQSLLGSA